MSGKKPPLRDSLRFYGKLVLILFGITAVSALLMALVNGLTQDRIASLAEDRRQAAMGARAPVRAPESSASSGTRCSTPNPP